MQTFEQANKKIKEKFPYLDLLEYNGSNKICKFLDNKFGEFSAKYILVYVGDKKHRQRVLENINKNKIKTIDVAIIELNEKFKYLKLIEYTGYNNKATFEDLEFGIFKAKYNNVFRGITGHSERKKIEKLIKYKETCIKKYGCENAAQSNCVKNKKIKTNLIKYGVDHVSKLDHIKNKIKKGLIKKINDNFVYNIDGYCLSEYIKINLPELKYNTVQQNYKKYGNQALKIDFYNRYNGKSKIADQWLNLIENNLGYKLIREYHIKNTLFHVDGFDIKTNTVYEFYGDYWHGNLNIFNEKKIQKTKNVTFRQLYEATLNREEMIINLGYKIINIWELDFKSNK